MIPLFIIPCVGLALAPVDVPKLFVQQEFNSRDLAQAANYFAAMGEEKAAKKIAFMASDFFTDWKRANAANNQKRTNFSLNSRLSWMCRILYEPKGINPLRPPGFGALSLPQLTMPLSRWPLYPLVLSGNTYFVLADGYSLGGRPETLEEYLAYCQANGKFRNKPVALPDRNSALKDFDLLTKSENWKAIKWKDSGIGQSYLMHEPSRLQFIKTQAEGIPKK
ncbi:MAG TPA: hypothetical protein VGP68_03585 [Gemmataceae bacterium]|jgi:hypothetical protein|nr:hypothetical protein [Gemmataceae bacterium]